MEQQPPDNLEIVFRGLGMGYRLREAAAGVGVQVRTGNVEDASAHTGAVSDGPFCLCKCYAHAMT